MAEPRPTSVFIGPVLVAAGCCLLVIMVLVERHQRAVRSDAVRTTGSVVALLPRRSGSSTMYAPLVRFRNDSGQQFDITASSAANPPSYRIGDNVPVIYSRLNPEDADIDSWSARWLKTVLLGVLGVLSLGSGVASMRAARSSAREDV